MSDPTDAQPAAPEGLTDSELRPLAQSMLESIGRGVPRSLTPLPGGGNNRVFRVTPDDGDPVLLKAYYRHPDDPRDRLGHEFAFSRFAWGRGLRGLPEPLARDDTHGIALYGYIDGHMLPANEVTPYRVDEAIAFFAALNAHRGHPDAAALPTGSESCFTNLEHVALVDQRVRRLDQIGDPGTAAFVERELKPAWSSIHPKIAKAQDALAESPRCLSPSDFGFHNALCPHTPAGANGPGRLVFHDFEYAGWDDPAKLLGDFFHQPRRPAPWSCYRRFEDAVIETLGLEDTQRSRFRTLLPVYRVKWCSIILAPLLPGAAQRRQYAGVEVDPADIVERARKMLLESHAPDH